ncbi:Rod shape-determining protein MreD [Deinococcus radiopugnans]|uniref:Rod shape-determining protein MreD n=1 Tax=Deinococcus radiopugnans ATCC 19172 TaxID=585398 RepID=A0ABR6NWU8_9DEIO|nr:Rod shape-determining protein MreD [Deinococcus radiopugnans]MBB6017381.1 rod shape-determining protein MreD [Deinococcus radiopugnans ATCC 19172]
MLSRRGLGQRGMGGGRFNRGGLGRGALGPRASLPQRGPARVFRAVVYAALLIAAQGLLSRLADSAGLAAPDLFLLTAVALAWRMAPAWALVAAYGVGLSQDLLGGGVLGLHAAGLAGAVLLVLLIRRYVADSGPLQVVLSVVGAVAGEWLTFGLLAYWLRSNLITVNLLLTTIPSLLIGTLLAYPLWEWAVRWGIGPRPGPQEKLA